MATIGKVTKKEDGSYSGSLKMLGVRASITIVPVKNKKTNKHPDYLVNSQGAEIGVGWDRESKSTGEVYVSLSLSSPQLGSDVIYCNLGRSADSQDENDFNLIWNAQKKSVA